MSEVAVIGTGGIHIPELRPRGGEWPVAPNFPIPGQRTASSRPPQYLPQQAPIISTVEAKAFDALVKAKVLTSKVATHLPDSLRKRLFLALDRLHEIEEWEQGDSPVLEQSFNTFMRSTLVLKPARWPSIGMTVAGYLFATWGNATDRITVEYLEADWAQWTVSFVNEAGQIVRGAGTSPALEIRRYVSAYKPEHWFDEIRQVTT